VYRDSRPLESLGRVFTIKVRCLSPIGERQSRVARSDGAILATHTCSGNITHTFHTAARSTHKFLRKYLQGGFPGTHKRTKTSG
jgi:translation initiation factor 2B subunit (eIF-2B alpha/beta/delta family)